MSGKNRTTCRRMAMSMLRFHECTDSGLHAAIYLGGRANRISAQPLEPGPLR